MGNWTMVIEGVGPHHNDDNKGDADRQIKEIVEHLRAAGHAVTYASVVCGAGNVAVNDACENLRAWAEKNGLDTFSTNQRPA